MRSAEIVVLALLLAGCASTPDAATPTPTPAPPAPAPAPEPAPVTTSSGNPVLDRIARELDLQGSESRALARHFFLTGKARFDELDYRAALADFDHAHGLDPEDVTIAQYLRRTQFLVGDRKAELGSTLELLSGQHEAAVEQERIDVERLFDEGVLLSDARRYDEAIRRFEIVLEKIRWFPYELEKPDLETRARERLAFARARATKK
jgi:tetratricopeptide (TPR) repeat protein